MTPELISAIQTFTLNSRKLLERETEEQLQGLYGWLPDGSFGVGTALGLPEAAETRERLERYVAEEKEAGLDAAAARAKLKRETAFTWLNRTVAIRLMEERGIIKSTFAKLHKSNAFIYWLTDVKGEASIPASTPVNALGEGPVDAAYREFLLWQCEQLAAEVSVLFDPATLSSRFCPRPAVLKVLAESMNATGLAEAWKAGNEETIGWIYEGFIEDENAVVFEKFSKGKKVLAEEIGAATQRFTPRWIVQFLVQNSIGRIWAEMHPGSRFAASLEYLVPLKSGTERPLKPVKDITFLDPCCGSMHFGLLAFDLFAGMYREERENAGKPGWPETPSASTEEEIPELILSQNLHGIDIDTRAVQISALALMLKARTLNPKTVVTDSNLACANIEQLTGGRLDDFISATPFSHPIYERVLRRLASRLKDSDHLGSLLRIEVEIEQLVNAERKQSTNLFEQLPGFDPEQFNTQEGVEEFFSILTDQIGRHLDHFVQASGGGLFASEAAKGLRFLRLVERRYDVVATNPPYMSRRNMSDVMATYLDDGFKSSKGDLYAAFIMRGVELADPLGLVAMVTQQSFMFISSYEDMRIELRKTTAIEAMAHLGPRAFPNITGEKVNTTAFVLRRESDAKRREGQIGTYFRLVKERDADAKRLSFESALAAIGNIDPSAHVFLYEQGDFDSIPKKPWVYWITARIRRIFAEMPNFKQMAEWKRGLSTGDNPRFIRFWWELGNQRATEGGWQLCAKGGPFRRWHGNQFFAINFMRDASEMTTLLTKKGKPAAYLRNTSFYGVEGICYNSISSKGLSSRYMAKGHIFDQASNTIFPIKRSIHETLAILNSKISQWVLSLNPTINIVKDDLDRIPFPPLSNPRLHELGLLATRLSEEYSGLKELEWAFSSPPRTTVDEKLDSIARIEAEIDNVLTRAFALSEEEYSQFTERVADLENVTPDAESDDESDSSDTENITDEGIDDDTAATNNLSLSDWGQRWISYAFGIALGRFEIGKTGGLGCGNFPETTITAIRNLIDPDGIMPCEAGHPQDIVARAFACLELMLGATDARVAIRNATDTDGEPVEALRGWLDRFTGQPAASFWRYHHQLYRKRPVYWPFQSPQKTLTVWVFHEKIGPNTLHAIKELADVRLNHLERTEIPELRIAAATNRAKEKDLQKLLDQSDDIREFSNRLKAHIDSGYQSCIDDGVLLNAAPLHDLFPNWTDTKKAWEELKAGKYDWAHQAMRHWPDRVTEACRSNRSFAIAHGLEHLCPAAPPKSAKKRTSKKLDLNELL